MFQYLNHNYDELFSTVAFIFTLAALRMAWAHVFILVNYLAMASVGYLSFCDGVRDNVVRWYTMTPG